MISGGFLSHRVPPVIIHLKRDFPMELNHLYVGVNSLCQPPSDHAFCFQQGTGMSLRCHICQFDSIDNGRGEAGMMRGEEIICVSVLTSWRSICSKISTCRPCTANIDVHALLLALPAKNLEKDTVKATFWLDWWTTKNPLMTLGIRPRPRRGIGPKNWFPRATGMKETTQNTWVLRVHSRKNISFEVTWVNQ